MNQVAKGRGSAGGAANEAGSLHRAGVAAVLAVYGLLETALPYMEGGIPSEIQLETLDATDDIVCTLLDESKWFIQAKRSVGVDGQLRSTIKQWSKQPVNNSDRLVLAGAELKGHLRALQPVLDRLAANPNAILSSAEDVAKTVFLRELDEQSPGQGSVLFAKIRLLAWPVESEDDALFARCAAMLDGSLVETGRGSAAFRSLRSYFQRSAAVRGRSNPADWVEALVADGIEVFADMKGKRGLIERAASIALHEYRESWLSQLDRLDFSMLFQSVPDLTVDGLVHKYQVQWRPEESDREETADLYTLARRNRRFIVEGLPGMGKSSAFRQVAAKLASDESAPTPILFDLKGIGGRINTRADINISLMLSQASQVGIATDPESLETALRRELVGGNVILLVDGLDETLDKASIVAAGLSDLIGSINENCGVLLSTRSSALVAAQQTGLPRVELITPKDLKDVLVALFAAISCSDKVSGAEQWLEQKKLWLTASMNEHQDIWNVPLLATLTAYRAAQGASETPNSAALLHEVIQESVRKWEYSRKSVPPGGEDRELRPQMLLEGFSAIGHALNSNDYLTAENAVGVVADEITEWGFPAPITTGLARQILWFWDNSVGVFVEVDGIIVARSRQFSELGDAYWATRNINYAKNWLEVAVQSESKRVAVGLAANLEPLIVRELFDLASTSEDPTHRARAISWILDVSKNTTVPLDDKLICQLTTLLGQAASAGLANDDKNRSESVLGKFFQSIDEHQIEVDGAGWSFAYSLAALPMPISLRAHRDSTLAGLHLRGANRKLVEALVSLTDSDYDDGSILDPSAIQNIVEILSVPLPDEPRTLQIPGQPMAILGSPWRPISGTSDVAVGAANRLSQLPSSIPMTLYAVAKSLSYDVHDQIAPILRAHGHSDPDPIDFSFPGMDRFLRNQEDMGGWGWLLRAISAISTSELSQTGVAEWRWAELSDLIYALGYHGVTFGEFDYAATVDSDLIVSWVTAVATAADISIPAIVMQSKRLIDLNSAHDSKEITNLIDERCLVDIDVDSHRISSTQAIGLVPVLLSNSNWLSNSALRLLINQNDSELADTIRSDLGELKSMTRWRSCLVRCTNSQDVVSDIRELLNSDSPPRRKAAASYLKQFHDGELTEFWENAISDDDLSVRDAVGEKELVDPMPVFWSCRWCASRNELQDASCRGCNLASRPGIGSSNARD